MFIWIPRVFQSNTGICMQEFSFLIPIKNPIIYNTSRVDYSTKLIYRALYISIIVALKLAVVGFFKIGLSNDTSNETILTILDYIFCR